MVDVPEIRPESQRHWASAGHPSPPCSELQDRSGRQCSHLDLTSRIGRDARSLR